MNFFTKLIESFAHFFSTFVGNFNKAFTAWRIDTPEPFLRGIIFTLHMVFLLVGFAGTLFVMFLGAMLPYYLIAKIFGRL